MRPSSNTKWHIAEVIILLAVALISVMSDPGIASNGDEDDNAKSTDKTNPPTANESPSQCCQPGRIDSAKHILAQVAQFKLQASQSRVDIQKAVSEASKLRSQAGTLAKVPPGSAANYKSSLQQFATHAEQYRNHLLTLENQIGTCHQTEQAYNAQLNEYALHVSQFHIADIPPPHICGHLNYSEGQAANVANSMRADMQRLAQSEAQLASAESRLAIAVDNSVQQDQNLLKRSVNNEGERQLQAEYARLKTEYDLLNIQHRALIGAGLKDPARLVRVSGKVISKH